jgi:septal ring factor EnvC (AmiA/AmiB activator)
MFAPDVEARFKRIEDAHIVAAELLDRFERKTDERMDRLEAIQNAMARWVDRIAERQEEDDRARKEMRESMREMQESVAELSRTVDRFLKSRSNGGVN